MRVCSAKPRAAGWQVGPGSAALAHGGFHFEGVLPGEVEAADKFLAGIGCWGWASSRRGQDPVRREGQQRQSDEEQPDDDHAQLFIIDVPQ